MRVTLSPPDTLPPRRRRSFSRRKEGRKDHQGPVKRWRRIVPDTDCPQGALCHVKQVRRFNPREILCIYMYTHHLLTWVLIILFIPPVRVSLHSERLLPHLVSDPGSGTEARRARVKVHFLLDSLHFDFSTVGNEAFSYESNQISTHWPRTTPANRITTNLAASSL